MKSVGQMAVRKSKNGKTWDSDFYPNGSKFPREIKQHKTKKAAEAYLRRRMSTEITARDTKMQENFNTLKVKEIADIYLNEVLLKGKAYRNGSYINGIKKKWGEVTLSQVSTPDVKSWIRDMVDKGDLAISTIQKHLTYFKRVFSYF